MKISFLLMSRERSFLCWKSIQSLISNAVFKQRIEIICRLDSCDLTLGDYLVNHSGAPTFIIGPRWDGYLSFGRMVDQCAKLATGDLLWQWSDDAFMQTQGYDRIVEESLSVSKDGIYVMSSQLVSNVSSGDYPFGFFAIPRKLYEINGSFSLGQRFGYDRCYEEIAKELNCEIKSGVTISHEYQKDKIAEEGIDRASAELEVGRTAFFTLWNAVGKHHARMIREKIS